MKECLLDRNGYIHNYNYENGEPISVHHEIAQLILPNEEYPLDVLIDRGWVVLGSRFKSAYSGKSPNNLQRNTLYDLNIKIVSDFYSRSNYWKIF